MNRLGIKCFILGTFVLVFFAAADRGEVSLKFRGGEDSGDDNLSDYSREVDSCLNELCGPLSE